MYLRLSYFKVHGTVKFVMKKLVVKIFMPLFHLNKFSIKLRPYQIKSPPPHPRLLPCELCREVNNSSFLPLTELISLGNYFYYYCSGLSLRAFHQHTTPQREYSMVVGGCGEKRKNENEMGRGGKMKMGEEEAK
jgi:hypothetical protein